MKHLAYKLHHIITTLQNTNLSTPPIYHVEITAYRDNLSLSDQLDVKLENIYRDDFPHEDHRKLEQSINAINFHDIHV